jgi:Zn finger protein HypA/HybF involved in hydrogenase expression
MSVWYQKCEHCNALWAWTDEIYFSFTPQVRDQCPNCHQYHTPITHAAYIRIKDGKQPSLRLLGVYRGVLSA